MICDVGYWEAAAYLLAAFILGGIMGLAVMATLAGGRE